MTASQPWTREVRSRGNTLDRLTSRRAQSIMLLVIAIGASGLILSHAQAILAPALFAVTVGIVVSPMAERLNKWGVPRAATASALLVIASCVLAASFILLEPLLSTMVQKLPEIRAEIKGWIDGASGLLRGIENLSEEIEQTVGTRSGADEAPNVPTLMDAIWLAPNLASSVLVFAGTLFFFVLTRAELYGAAGQMSDALFRADRAVSQYFAAVTMVNIGLGVATALALTAMGLPYAVLWALAAAVLNYLLYLGPLAIYIGLLVAGMVQFSGAMALLPMGAFMVINLTEAQFVTPAVVGQRLHMSPLAAFLAIVVGLWLWGPVGGIVALPVTLWLTVLLRDRPD